MRAYHDLEWGVPVYNDTTLFEFLLLEGAQAGLSWRTVLRKRENYRRAFANFDASKVAAFDQNDIDNLLANPGIVRNRLKIRAAITNAQQFLTIQQEFGSFSDYIWRFVNHIPLRHHWHTLADIPTTIPQAINMSTDLKKRGFKFVGPTIMYAFMQAVGLVNDHVEDCYRYSEI